MTLNVSEQAQPQASKALSGTQKAPLFSWGPRWGHIQDGLGIPNPHVAWYFRETSSRSPEGTILVVSDYFSPLVRSWFEGNPDGDIQRGPRGHEYLHVFPTHPLYPQVKVACDSQQACCGDDNELAFIAEVAA
ncbi:hypothetical protein LOD50_10555 [Xylella fastidiosa subsp. multiplex]|uniref:Uncharacterized protein n=1 Tax=Xylella fastidiosa subsp. multiplex TaxID=644357 RepID=A0AAW6HUX5_XYLFS|nr:hypothetical protein [Xylella fastidiosa]MDC6408593.1 hypothetical protein [Xylella fastidiosa subsp. multiplex]MDD0936812.1 hypothetical protein [Xylella fastidiosa subsp. multiplex]MSS67805.1 hypothetical protein [Xylella fastidiosa subsp. multiplex]